MPRSRVEERRRRLRLDILEVPWDPEGREIVRAEMAGLGVNQDDLYIALRNARLGSIVHDAGPLAEGPERAELRRVGAAYVGAGELP